MLKENDFVKELSGIVLQEPNITDAEIVELIQSVLGIPEEAKVLNEKADEVVVANKKTETRKGKRPSFFTDYETEKYGE